MSTPSPTGGSQVNPYQHRQITREATLMSEFPRGALAPGPGTGKQARGPRRTPRAAKVGGRRQQRYGQPAGTHLPRAGPRGLGREGGAGAKLGAAIRARGEPAARLLGPYVGRQRVGP
jgi:hypothetical protein